MKTAQSENKKAMQKKAYLAGTAKYKIHKLSSKKKKQINVGVGC